MRTLGHTVYRLSWEGESTSLNAIVTQAQAFRADAVANPALPPLKLYVTMDVSTLDINNGNVTFTSEALARAYGVTCGQTVANALASYADVVIAVAAGNEMMTKDSMMGNASQIGTDPGDYNNAKWPIFRGVMAGCLAGFKSVVPAAIPVFSNAWCLGEIGAPIMLRDGTNPDGTSGGEKVVFDGYDLHSYRIWGNTFMMPYSTSGGWLPFFNLVERFYIEFGGRPLYLSEFNANGNDTDPVMAAWVQRMNTQFFNARYDLNIAGMNYYMQYDGGDGTWGCVDSSGLLTVTKGQMLRQFIVQNPDVSPTSLEQRALNILNKYPPANVRLYRPTNAFSNSVATGTPSNGGAVPLWPDVFQNSGAAGIQGTSPPTWVSGAQPALTFNGNPYAMTAPFNLVGDDFAVIVGAAPTGTANAIASSRAAVALSATNASSHYGRIGAIMYSTSGITAEWYGDTGGDFQATYNPGTYAAANVATSRKVGNTGSLRVNGAQRATVDLTSFTSGFVPNAGWIGAQYANDTAGFTGNIYGVIAVKGGISDADLLVLEQWMNSMTPTGVNF